MATIKQQKLAKAIVENLDSSDPMTLQDILVSVGYADATAEKNGADLMRRPGFIQAMAKLGFTEENAKSTVAEIMLDRRKKASDRIKAAEQVFKVSGSYAPEKTLSLGLEIKTTSEELKKMMPIKEEFEKKAFNQLTNE